MTKKLLYRINPQNNVVVFAKPERAELVHRINSAIESSKTWREFRKAMPPDEYSKIVHIFDDNGHRRPRGDDPFDGEQIPGVSDGDYPPWLQQEMDSLLPRSFFDRFAERVSTSLNGCYWEIAESRLVPALAALGQLGYEVEEAADLNFG